MSLMVAKQNMYCKYTRMHKHTSAAWHTVCGSVRVKEEHTAQLNRHETQMEGPDTCLHLTSH